MDSTWWKPGFLLLEWKLTDKQGEKERMLHVVISKGWRHEHGLTFTLM